jgi:hypothetical protein
MSDFWSSILTIFTNEADVELRLVIPLLNALGYEQADVVAKYPVVFREGRVGPRPEADFVCFNGPLHNRDTSLLVVEATPATHDVCSFLKDDLDPVFSSMPRQDSH